MENERTYKLYIHIFPNKKAYVGITNQEPKKRWANGKGYKSNPYINNAIEKYGWDNVIHKVLYDNLSKNEAEEKEVELIKKYKSNNRNFGYNIENGGKCVGTVSQETKNKIGLKSKEFWKDVAYREKQRIAHIGKYPDNTGRKRTLEERQKISQATKGIIPWNKGKPMSLEVKEKLRVINKGKTLSDYHKERLHEGSLKAGKNREKPVICIETNKIYESIKIAAIENNTYHSNIIKAINGERKTAGGYTWKYVE